MTVVLCVTVVTCVTVVPCVIVVTDMCVQVMIFHLMGIFVCGQSTSSYIA